MKLYLLQYAYNEKNKGRARLYGPAGRQSVSSASGRLSADLDSSLIWEGGSIGFMLSQRMFIKHVMLPGLPSVFEGSNISQFLLNDNNVIRNNGSIPLNKPDDYPPTLISLTL